MKNPNIVFIGMDTHKEHSSIPYLLDGYSNESIYFGKIKSTKTALQKLVRQLQSKFSSDTLHFIYEADPCGYWMYRLRSFICFITSNNYKAGLILFKLLS